jgi:hypothetical protein
MAQNAANVAAANPVVTGGLLWGPPGTALPTDATTALAAAYKPLGYISEDGIQPSGDAASTDDTVAWGGDVVARLVTQKRADRYTFKLIEVLSDDVLTFLFGEDNVTVTPAAGDTPTLIAVADNGGDPAEGVFVVEAFYKGIKMRRVIPNGSPILNSEDPLTHSAIGGYEVEMACLPDDSGNRQYRYYAKDDAPGA